MIATLKHCRAQGYTYDECGKVIGLSQTVARQKGVELGLPRRMNYSRYSGKVMAHVATLPPSEIPTGQRCVAPVLRQLGVGDHATFPVWSFVECKRIRKLVSGYAVSNDKGFRSNISEDGTELRVERVR